MRWQRPARFGLAALGIATAVAIYVTTRERPTIERPTLTEPADPSATSQSGEGVDVRFVNDVERWRVEYGATRAYPDGRLEFDRVHLTFKEDGTELWSDRVETRGLSGTSAPASFRADGHVRLRTGDGATAEGESAVYEDDTGVTRIPGPVAFSRGRFSGTGTNALYERHGGIFRIEADARVVSTPSSADAAPAREAGPAPPVASAPAGDASDASTDGASVERQIVATATSLVFNRAANALLFDTNARIEQGTDVMTADRATLYLTEDNEDFRVIELRGNAQVIPDAAGGSETPEMRARDIDLAFYEGTQLLQRAVLGQQARMIVRETGGTRSIEGQVINLQTAPDGKTMTHLEANGRVVVQSPPSGTTPARRVTASELIATGTESAGLTAATFTGGVTFLEEWAPAPGRTGSQRTGTGQTLVMKLKGQLDAIDEAEFQQSAHFVDGDVTGDADFGVYLVSQGQMRLRPHPRTPRLTPVVTDGAMRVEASRLIEIDLNSRNLHALGGIKTINTEAAARRGGAGGGGARRTGVLRGSGSTYGFGEEFWYDRAKSVVTYQGTETTPAHVKQGDSDIFARRIELDDRTRDLRAAGAVQSTMTMEPRSGQAGTTSYRATAETMVYADAAGTITYDGAPVTLIAPDGQTRAAHVVLTLGADGRTLEKMDAKGDPKTPELVDVLTSIRDGHEAMSESLLYDAARDRYTFRGRPVVLRAHERDGGCTETRGNYGWVTPGGNVTFPEGEQNPSGSESVSVPCTGALKK